MTLRKRPPIPYVPEKDSVQETISSYKETHLKTLIKEGTELRVPIWHSGTREAFLIHVGSAREVIEKKGYFKSFEDHSDDYSKKRGKVKELKKQLEALKESLVAQPQDPKETTVEADDDSSAALHAETRLISSKPRRLQWKPRPYVIRRPRTCSSSTQTFCLST
jgi:hypothetical protein